MARKRTLAAALATVGYLQVAPAWSLGLGEITLQSFLNEPLRASVSLINAGNLHEDQIRVRLATSEDFDRLGVERAYFLTGIKFEVSLDQQGNGQILLTSEDPVLEPYLDFIVEARWPAGRLLRNYTVLVDPPGNLPASRTVSASEQLASEAAERAPAEATQQPAEPPTGDRVDLRTSSLGQGDMPRRAYSADTAERPEPGGRYMIRRDETLWTIAQRARPDGATVQQTMLEIQRLNPDAFIDGNINRIKAGYIIYLPDSGDMSPADIEQVREQIRQQNADWRAGRSSDPQASSAALRLASGSDEQGGPAVTPEAVAPAGASSQEQNREDAGAGPTAAAADTAAREELEQASQERDELSQQLASLGERLASLERMVEMRDAQIAELQAALAEAQARPAADGDSATGQVAAGDDRQSASSPQAAETSNTWWYALGGGALAGLLALLLWRRRQQSAEAGATFDSPARKSPAAPAGAGSDAFAGVELRDQDVELDLDEEMAAAAPTIAAPQSAPGPQRGYGERKHDQYAADVDTSDALAEADIYVAYGRFPQAMELLRKAISADPDNASYRLRLLELAVETGNREEAEQQLEALRGIGDAGSIEAAENLLLGGAAFDHQPAEPGEDNDLEADLASAFASDDPPAEVQPEPEIEPSSPSMAAGEFQGNLSDFGRAEEPVEDLSDDLPDLSRPGDGLDEQVPGIAEDDSEFLGLEIEGGEEALDLTRGSDAATSDEDDFVFADDGDPIATKLDLARAYIDMGDEAGARDILEEVLGTGSSEQQQDARELLDRLG